MSVHVDEMHSDVTVADRGPGSGPGGGPGEGLGAGPGAGPCGGEGGAQGRRGSESTPSASTSASEEQRWMRARARADWLAARVAAEGFDD